MLYPKSYVCPRAPQPVRVDGRLSDPAWAVAPWTEPFVDIEGSTKPSPRYRTRAKMLWDESYFYVGAEMEEPHLWATLTEHDSVIFQDNDFEVFIDPDWDNYNYFEIEVNALGTEWDLSLDKPYRDGGNADNGWEIPGLKLAVQLRGTLNDPRDKDDGWSVELAIPWSAMGRATPQPGEQWRVNFSRVEWELEVVEGGYRKVAGRPEDNWVWSPQHAVDMHRPEKWGIVQFSERAEDPYRPDSTLRDRLILHEHYYAQKEFRERHGTWSCKPLVPGVALEKQSGGYVAISGRVRMNHESKVWVN